MAGTLDRSLAEDALRRCLLFVPGNRPDRYEKAIASGADAVCIDLEDAVAPDAKDEGRRQAIDFLGKVEARLRVELILRINDVDSDVGRLDVEALWASGARPDAVMVPKVRAPDQVRQVGEWLTRGQRPPLPLILLVETVQALACVEDLARAPYVSALLFGAVDLSAEMGCAIDWDALLYARSRVVHAAALGAIDAIDVPNLDVADPDGLARECQRVARLGFRGKAAIHPTQVPIIQAAFSPSSAEIERARKIVAAYERNRGGVLLVDGKLVEKPVIASAQRTLAIAEAVQRG